MLPGSVVVVVGAAVVGVGRGAVVAVVLVLWGGGGGWSVTTIVPRMSMLRSSRAMRSKYGYVSALENRKNTVRWVSSNDRSQSWFGRPAQVPVSSVTVCCVLTL